MSSGHPTAGDTSALSLADAAMALFLPRRWRPLWAPGSPAGGLRWKNNATSKIILGVPLYGSAVYGARQYAGAPANSNNTLVSNTCRTLPIPQSPASESIHPKAGKVFLLSAKNRWIQLDPITSVRESRGSNSSVLRIQFFGVEASWIQFFCWNKFIILNSFQGPTGNWIHGTLDGRPML